MQNTLANRCQTRINGGCEVEFNPHHGELVCTLVQRRWQDPESHSLVLGTGQNNFGSLFKPGLASRVPKGKKPRVNQFCRLWGWSDGMPLPSFPMQSPVPVLQTLAALSKSGTLQRARCPSAFLGCSSKPFLAFGGRMGLQKSQKGLWLRQGLQQVYGYPKFG